MDAGTIVAAGSLVFSGGLIGFVVASSMDKYRVTLAEAKEQLANKATGRLSRIIYRQRVKIGQLLALVPVSEEEKAFKETKKQEFIAKNQEPLKARMRMAQSRTAIRPQLPQ